MAQCVEKIAEKSVEKIELRAVIRFLHLKGNNAKSIHAENPYSPDLAPSDFFLFPRMKSPMRGRRFQDDDEVIAEVEHFLNTQSEDFYNQGLRQLIHRWEKCVALCGSYVEKD